MENTIERQGIPLLGDKFPKMTVQTTHGMKVLPDDMKGKWFVLFSHPADFTPVCTTEFVAFQQRYEKFRELNTELIGLSIDQVFSHIKWEEWIKEKMGVEIQFPIIADTGAVAEKLGLIHPGKGSNTVRAVFIVDAMAPSASCSTTRRSLAAIWTRFSGSWKPCNLQIRTKWLCPPTGRTTRSSRIA